MLTKPSVDNSLTPQQIQNTTHGDIVTDNDLTTPWAKVLSFSFPFKPMWKQRTSLWCKPTHSGYLFKQYRCDRKVSLHFDYIRDNETYATHARTQQLLIWPNILFSVPTICIWWDLVYISTWAKWSVRCVCLDFPQAYGV